MIGDSKRSPTFGPLYADLDLAKLKVRDARTVEVPLTRARGDFVESVLAQISLVFPDGTTDQDWPRGVGSGPFRLVSAAAGGGVTLARNGEYWGGAPLLDEATIAVVADPAARLNAVRGGQADYAVDVTPAGARSVANSRDVRIRRGGPGNSLGRSFEMNVQTDPFRDAEVRRALRLLVDRQQLVDNVLLGQGQVGNDGPGGTARSDPTRPIAIPASAAARAGASLTPSPTTSGRSPPSCRACTAATSSCCSRTARTSLMPTSAATRAAARGLSPDSSTGVRPVRTVSVAVASAAAGRLDGEHRGQHRPRPAVPQGGPPHPAGQPGTGQVEPVAGGGRPAGPRPPPKPGRPRS